MFFYVLNKKGRKKEGDDGFKEKMSFWYFIFLLSFPAIFSLQYKIYRRNAADRSLQHAQPGSNIAFKGTVDGIFSDPPF